MGLDTINGVNILWNLAISFSPMGILAGVFLRDNFGVSVKIFEINSMIDFWPIRNNRLVFS